MTCSQGYTLKKILLRTCPLTKWVELMDPLFMPQSPQGKTQKYVFSGRYRGEENSFLKQKPPQGNIKNVFCRTCPLTMWGADPSLYNLYEKTKIIFFGPTIN